MKLIIDIPEEDYNECKFRVKYLKDLFSLVGEQPTDLTFNMRMETLIANGTELPKGHGRLIDADKLLDENIDTFMLQTETKIRIAPTIIEADKENNNG